ncbi:MAG: hypothetical protein LBF60_03720 [Treponema sp.]|nr:hypothetical protein [Treponema sp.]
MKSLIAALILGLFFPIFCFSQSQTGDASYNASKSGYHIGHSSLSFGARVRVINLNNNQQVIATVDSRIPASDPRVADVYRDAGDAIGMAASGYTQVRIEQLPPEQSASAPVPVQPPAQAENPPSSTEPPPPAQAENPPPPAQTKNTPSSAGTPPPAQVENSPPAENIQIISPPPVQYVLSERPAQSVQSCAASPICVAILVLAIVAVALLVVILVLMLCRPCIPLWMCVHPMWMRRYVRYSKKHRR